MSALSTHVLDLSLGRPAADVLVAVERLGPGSREPLGEFRTDADGRARLIAPGELEVGTYVLSFHVAEHFVRTGAPVGDPPFLDRIAIEFTVADAGRHHHVPLLVSPYGYSTYRGS